MDNSLVLWNEIRQSKSKNDLNKDGDIQLKSMKKENTYKDFYSELVRNLMGKLPVTCNKCNSL